MAGKSRKALHGPLRLLDAICKAPVSAKAKNVLFCLTRYADTQTFRCHPSIQTIAKNTGRSPTYIREGFAELESEPLRVVRRPTALQRQQLNAEGQKIWIEIDVDRLEQLAANGPDTPHLHVPPPQHRGGRAVDRAAPPSSDTPPLSAAHKQRDQPDQKDTPQEKTNRSESSTGVLGLVGQDDRPVLHTVLSDFGVRAPALDELLNYSFTESQVRAIMVDIQKDAGVKNSAATLVYRLRKLAGVKLPPKKSIGRDLERFSRMLEQLRVHRVG